MSLVYKYLQYWAVSMEAHLCVESAVNLAAAARFKVDLKLSASAW
jgi:hypothetical protein